MYFPSVKVYVNGYKSGILHRATGYIEQSLYSRLIHDSDSNVKSKFGPSVLEAYTVT